jgi:hypothetical protein
MKSRYWAASLCFSLLAACTRHDAVPDGTVVIDEAITLSRGATADTATRELEVPDDSVVVAFVDEQLTDVSLQLATIYKKKPLHTAAVENNLNGAGIEVAALSVRNGAHVTITLTSAPAAKTPGAVRLRVRLYGTDPKPEHAAQLDAFEAWTEATDPLSRPDTYRPHPVEPGHQEPGVGARRRRIGRRSALDQGPHARLPQARLPLRARRSAARGRELREAADAGCAQRRSR